MWRRSSLALAREWRRAVPLGLRGMASVTSTGPDKCGGGDKGGDKGKHVEVPLPMHGVAGKYAAALYISAVRANALDPVRADLEQVAGVAGMETLFAEFLRDPSVPKPARVKACEEIFKETKFHDVSKNFMAVMAENGRLSFVQPIYSSYCKLLYAHYGEVEVWVTTALELTAAELEDIKKALGGQVKKGQNVKITQQVDRSIIGGIIVTIDDKIIDLSIDRKIKQMEKKLAEAV